MIISDLNYVEAVSEVEISGGNTASFGSEIRKTVTAATSQMSASTAQAAGGLSQVAIIGSSVGNINAPTTASATSGNTSSVRVSA